MASGPFFFLFPIFMFLSFLISKVSCFLALVRLQFTNDEFKELMGVLDADQSDSISVKAWS